jgi:hypothetical protein
MKRSEPDTVATIKKLTINRETVQTLSKPQLEAAWGGSGGRTRCVTCDQ